MIKIKLKRKLWFYPHHCPDCGKVLVFTRHYDQVRCRKCGKKQQRRNKAARLGISLNKMTGEDMIRLPSHIISTYDEETGTIVIIIPSEWAELIKKKLNYTAYGFEKDQLEFARDLMEAGITPFDLKIYMGGLRKLIKRFGL